MTNSFGVSVCITAYNATRFIKECLDSIEQQTWFRDRDNWEILVGVDNDPKTMRYLRKIMSNYRHIRVFMMNSNEGTYITINSLMYLTKYDYVVRFDADDIMNANCIEEAMALLRRDADIPLACVADAVGFSDPSNFSRQFRRFTGSSPQQWRELHYRY